MPHGCQIVPPSHQVQHGTGEVRENPCIVQYRAIKSVSNRNQKVSILNVLPTDTHLRSALWWCTTWCRVTERDISCIFLHFSETIWNKLKDLYNLIYISNHKHALSCCFQISARLLCFGRVYSRPTAPLFFGGHHATYILGLRGLAHRPIVRWFCCICCIAFSKLQYFTDFHSKSLLHFKIWTAI
jgi:hypothetical protein